MKDKKEPEKNNPEETSNNEGAQETQYEEQASEYEEIQYEENYEQDQPTEDSPIPPEDINFEKSSVVRDSKTNMLFVGVILAVVGVLAYYFVFNDSGKAKQTSSADDSPILSNTPVRAGDIPVPVVNQSTSVSSTDAISSEAFDAKKQSTPIAPPSPVGPIQPGSPTAPNAQNSLLTTSSVQSEQIKQAKIKSSMMLSGGNSGQGSSNQAQSNSNNSNATFDSSGSNIQKSSAARVSVTKSGDMSLLIVQGKIIEAVLETPINTSYPGPIRALISRDVFSERGQNVLIPKGSRVIGSIDGGFAPGQSRIIIKWTRVILPDGHDISMDSPGADRLGNLGVEGQVHREFFNNIGNSLLISAVNISLVKAVQDLFNIKSSTQTTSTAIDPATGKPIQTETSSLDPTQQAAKQEVEKLGQTTEQWMKNNFLTKPYIILNQGTILKIFVNQDIMFPEKLSGGMQVLQ